MRVAVIGAGAAGAGAAWALRDHADVTVFEERDDVGGRMATRRRGECIYDYGASYLKADDERVASLVRRFDDGLVDVGEPVWTFDAAGDVHESDRQDDHKWTWRGGLATLVERLLDAAGSTVETGTPVERLARLEGGWRVVVPSTEYGVFESVVATPPAPRTAALLRVSDWNDGAADRRPRRRPTGPPPGERLGTALDAVPYRAVYSAILGYGFELERPWYALVNTDREHDVSWVSREACKPGHVPEGQSVLVAQMAPSWSRERAEAHPGQAAADAARLVADLLGDDRLADPDWTDAHAWTDALADGALEREALAAARERDLFFAGDWVAGRGRAHLALRSGLDAGERIADR